ncbi:FGGY-family carbohydrate kinase [Thiorhodospira sibirica]|uniref:FGGY-family carbohydrate kinase n=1 Tax=Thiorhodospira sibirica TaxID=154347 RepID=UPI00022C0444|nr:FGGY-family carbohydrate kinase [Thiorhodospira sibirica]
MHQADWLSARLSGQIGYSDWNNALKLGFDVQQQQWPSWVKALIPPEVHLPQVLAPGTPLGTLSATSAALTGLSADTQVVAGTTDSTAAFIATGACALGDAVTSLGSTLVLKILSPVAVNDASIGVYSHRLGEYWLVGGASNSGGSVLRQFFSDAQIQTLSAHIDPTRPSGLNYYPLPAIGERFPLANPAMVPRLSPRPPDPALFLQGLLEGIAQIEAQGYAHLAACGAPYPQRILTVGGGSQNPAWTHLRQRILGVPIEPLPDRPAALGAAMLCLSK